MKFNLRWIVWAFCIFAAATAIVMGAAVAETAKKTNQPQTSITSFTSLTYNDSLTNISASVFLPDASGPWAVQEKYVGSDTSLLKTPQVFVESAFQNQQTKSFYGLIRVSENLQGYDCGAVFSQLSEADGLQLKAYVNANIEGVVGGKIYTFRYENKNQNIVATSKVLCDDKVAIEIFIVSPNDQKYADVIDNILRMAQMSIPGTSVSQ